MAPEISAGWWDLEKPQGFSFFRAARAGRAEQQEQSAQAGQGSPWTELLFQIFG